MKDVWFTTATAFRDIERSVNGLTPHVLALNAEIERVIGAERLEFVLRDGEWVNYVFLEQGVRRNRE